MANDVVLSRGEEVTAKAIVLELESGLETRDLSNAIDEINEARNSMSPKEYRNLLVDVNAEIDRQNILQDVVIDVLGVDESGKNLLVADKGVQMGLAYNEYGKPIRALSYDEMLAAYGHPRSLYDVGAAHPKNGNFSIFMPPGLNASAGGKFSPTYERREVKTDSQTGNIETMVAGELDDGEWRVNVNGFRQRQPTMFEGRSVTTGDGRLIESHVNYFVPKATEIKLLGSDPADYPELDSGPRIKIQELNGITIQPTSLDIKYNELSGSYVAHVGTTGLGHSFAIKEGFVQEFGEVKGGGLRDMAGIPPYRRNESGGAPITEWVRYRDGLVESVDCGQQKTKIIRDSNEEITAVEDSLHGKWIRTGPQKWLHENEVETGDLFVDGSNAIVMKRTDGTTTMYINSAIVELNEHSHVTRKKVIAGREINASTTEYSYDDSNRLILARKTEDRPIKNSDGELKAQRNIIEQDIDAGKPILQPLSFFHQHRIIPGVEKIPFYNPVGR